MEKRLQLFVKKEVQKWCSLHPEIGPQGNSTYQNATTASEIQPYCTLFLHVTL